MTGEGLLKIAVGWATEIAGQEVELCRVHIAEVFVQRFSWPARLHDAMEKPKSCLILFTIQHFKPEAAELILPGIKEDDFSSPSVKQKGRDVFIDCMSAITGLEYLTDLWPQNSTQNDV